MHRPALPPPEISKIANNGGAWPCRWFECRPGGKSPGRLEPCSAVVTGVLGVHRDSPGRLRNAPPPQSANRDQTTLFAFLQSHSFDHSRLTPGHGSKLRRRLTCVRQTFPAWPDPDRHPNHPASPHQSLVMISLSVRRWGESTLSQTRGDKPTHFSDKGLNRLRNF